MQGMLTTVETWCNKWRLRVKQFQSQVVHFRQKSCHETSHSFQFGSSTLNIVSQYGYLGIIFNEFINFDIAAKTLAAADGRTLGFRTFSKLYEVYIGTVINSASGVWGLKFSFFRRVRKNERYECTWMCIGLHQIKPLTLIWDGNLRSTNDAFVHYVSGINHVGWRILVYVVYI